MCTNSEASHFIHPLLRDNENETTGVPTTTSSSSNNIMTIQEEMRDKVRNDASLGRSSRFEATLQASIAQAMEMGRELMWHDSYTSTEESPPPQDMDSSREPVNDSDSLIATANKAMEARRQSSSSSRPRLYRRVTNESTVPVRRDSYLWAEFLRGKPRVVKSSCKARSVEHDYRNCPADLPRHVNVSLTEMDDDSVSCLDEDDDAASSTSISNAILNDFLYGDSMTQLDDGDDDDIDIDGENYILPCKVIDDWGRMAL